MTERTFKNDTYYWVKIRCENKWIVAHHTTAGLLYTTGTNIYLGVEEMLEIGEEIKPPEEPLKKCPFCGGNILRLKGSMSDMVFSAHIYCEPCNYRLVYKGGTGVETAKKFWNKRTP